MEIKIRKRQMGKTQEVRIKILELLEPFTIEQTTEYVKWRISRATIVEANLPQDWGQLLTHIYTGGINTVVDDIKQTVLITAYY